MLPELASTRSLYSLLREEKGGLPKSSLLFFPFSAVCSQQIKLPPSTALPHPMSVLWELRKRDTLVSSVIYKTKTKAEKLIHRGMSLPHESILTKST